MKFLFTFFEGLIAFISPCILPLLPLYLSYFEGGVVNRKKTKTLINAMFFVLGFSITFVLLGVLAGTLGKILIEHQKTIKIVLGLIVVCFGLSFFGVFKRDIFKGTVKYEIKNDLKFYNSMLFGIIFALSFTPCLGVYLSSALIAAATAGSHIKGALLLFCFSLGLGIPFIVSALLLNQITLTFSFIKKHYKIIKKISGSILIIMGMLMIFQLV